MASTNRFPRSLHKSNRRHPIRPMVEGLELRLVLSSAAGAAVLEHGIAEERIHFPVGLPVLELKNRPRERDMA